MLVELLHYLIMPEKWLVLSFFIPRKLMIFPYFFCYFVFCFAVFSTLKQKLPLKSDFLHFKYISHLNIFTIKSASSWRKIIYIFAFYSTPLQYISSLGKSLIMKHLFKKLIFWQSKKQCLAVQRAHTQAHLWPQINNKRPNAENTKCLGLLLQSELRTSNKS